MSVSTSDGRCSACFAPLETGYGLAGGGMGAYTYCPNEQCADPYFDKTQDLDGTEDNDNSAPPSPQGDRHQ